LPQLGANTARKRRVLTDDHGLHFLLEDRLHHARSAGDHAERSARPAGDARVRLEAEYYAAAIDAELVDGVVFGGAGRGLQDVGFERGNLDLFLLRGCGAKSGTRGRSDRGGLKKLSAVHAPLRSTSLHPNVALAFSPRTEVTRLQLKSVIVCLMKAAFAIA